MPWSDGLRSGSGSSRSPYLRLVEDPVLDTSEGERHSSSPACPAGCTSCVLLAGADRQQRSALREELAHTLPADTAFIEADEAWEVLQQAPASRMVMLAGDLREVSADSITRLLGRHYPSLPVLTLDDRPRLVSYETEPRVAHDSARDAI